MIFPNVSVSNLCAQFRFHTFQLQLCCSVTDKAAAAVLVQDRVHVS